MWHGRKNVSQKWIVLFLLLSICLTLFVGCSRPQEESSDNTDYQIDFDNAEEFENALNDGNDVNGKVVRFEVLEYKPDSALGHNCWAGEHLNFISSSELTVSSGDVVVGRIKSKPSKTFLSGSWKIEYEVLEIFPKEKNDENQAATTLPGMITIAQSSKYYVGKSYKDVVQELEQQGFCNISTEATYDLYFSTSKQEQVSEITIGDVSEFNKGNSFDPDEKVVVIYHMYYKDNPELRTYNGVVYDRAFICSGKDGLRAKFMRIYLFNEEDHTVRFIQKTTAGGLKTRGKSGSYEGSLDGTVTITWEYSDWEKSDPTTTFEAILSEDSSYWYDGSNKLSEIDVESGINKIKSW